MKVFFLSLFICMLSFIFIKEQIQTQEETLTFNDKKTLEYATSEIGEELVYMRGENVETFKADSGKVLSHIYTEPMFYQTDADTMARIDTSIKPIDELEREILYSAGWAAYDSIVDAGPYKFYWDKDGANSCFMRDGKYLLYEMVSEKNGVSTTYSPTTSGIKELIKVDNDTLKTITWNVAGNIATIYNYGDGQYDLQDGGFLFRINKPVAWDDSGKAVEISTLYTNGILSYTWDNSDVVYPVWVDPTTVYSNGAGAYRCGRKTSNPIDASKYSDFRNAVAGDANSIYLSIGQDRTGSSPNYTYHIYRSTVYFNIRTISPNVSGASLNLCLQEDTSLADFTLNICAAYGDTALNKKDTGKWNAFRGWASSGAYSVISYGTFNTASLPSAGNFISIPFNSTGIDSLNNHIGTAVTIQIEILSSTDISCTAPTTYEVASFYHSPYFGGSSAQQCYLSLSYHTSSTLFGPFRPINEGISTPFIKSGSTTPILKGN